MVFINGCDQLSEVTSGVETGIRSVRNSISGNNDEDDKKENTTPDLVAIGDEEEDTPSDESKAEPVSLSAFTDFRCSEEWTVRDGGWGLTAGSGSGVCLTTFSGVKGKYKILFMAQTEFDGDPIYEISVNGNTVSKGRYPYSTEDRLICDCPNWRANCPDKIVAIDIGDHELDMDYVIELYGEEVYPCGKYGAYAKWRGMEFIPVE